MQLLSALEQMVETLWLAIAAATVSFAVGMAVHAASRLLRRCQPGLRVWARRAAAPALTRDPGRD